MPTTNTATAAPGTTDAVTALRTARATRARRRWLIIGILAAAVAVLFAVSLMIGETFYPPADIIAVIAGQQVPGASYTVGELRLPRACLAVLAGLSFGVAGVTFQTMLRNQLASPDIIGISSGASAAGVIGIVMFNLSQTAVSLLALVAALAVAAAIYLLSLRGGFAGTRLILIGIGMAAMLQSVVTYTLSKASSWDLPTATRWLSGSLNGATWDRVAPVAVTVAVVLPVMLLLAHQLSVLRLGEDSATGLGVRVGLTRPAAVVGAVTLIAVATAACGPIAFVALMAGPVAARLVGPGGSLTLPAGLVGAVLVLGADLIGQFLLGTRYPVGVVTGVLGAPYLIYLLIRSNR
ncbi:FecCD family ABC transporter permease [Corynebacterium halotolerans]|nr:iron ABC transporter permease [Corynebacterium halotolerans]